MDPKQVSNILFCIGLVCFIISLGLVLERFPPRWGFFPPGAVLLYHPVAAVYATLGYFEVTKLGWNLDIVFGGGVMCFGITMLCIQGFLTKRAKRNS